MALLSAAAITIFLVSLMPLPQLAAASDNNSSYFSAHLTIQTSGAFPVQSYSVAAYNSSGWPVATYQGQYPQVSFSLPQGTYLFAADAFGLSSKSQCVYSGTAQPTVPAAGGAANGQAPAQASMVMPPCGYYNNQAEYGYSLTKLTGEAAVTVSTHTFQNTPTADVSVTVDYKNGTGIAGAQVNTAVVGGMYPWSADTRLTMYAQTGKDGVAHLTVPAVPLTITAWKSVPISIPKSQSIVQVEIGGQLVNVTVYYGPTYVSLTGRTLLVPPQTTATITATVQQQPGYPIPVPYAMGSSTGAGVAVGAPSAAATAPPNASENAAGQVPTTTTTTTAASAGQFDPIPALSPNDVARAATAQQILPASRDYSLAAGVIGLAALLATLSVVVLRVRR